MLILFFIFQINLDKDTIKFKEACNKYSVINLEDTETDSPSAFNRGFFNDGFNTPTEAEPSAKRSKMNVLERLSNPSPGIVRFTKLLLNCMVFQKFSLFIITTFIANNYSNNYLNFYLFILFLYLYLKL